MVLPDSDLRAHRPAVSESVVDVLRYVEDESPDVIHLATPGPVGLCGLAAGFLLGIPLVGSYHTELGPYALQLTRDLAIAEAMGLYVDWFYRRCEIVLAPTKSVADSLVERGVAAQPDVSEPGRRHGMVHTESKTCIRFATSSWTAADLLLLFVGRVSPEKRLDVLLSAFALANEAHGGLRLVIVGDGPARAELERTAPEGVRFLGELRGSALADLYASADAFCFSSTTDTFGQVLLEAGASALPVVAARAGGAVDLVGHDVTGLLVDPESPQAFARALQDLAGSEQLRRRLGASGRLAALDRTWDRSLAELRTAYQRIVSEHIPSPERRVAA